MTTTTTLPHTRLFILGGKGIPEDDLREAFGTYGTVKDVWIVKNKQTNEDKGNKLNCLFMIISWLLHAHDADFSQDHSDHWLDCNFYPQNELLTIPDNPISKLSTCLGYQGSGGTRLPKAINRKKKGK